MHTPPTARQASTVSTEQLQWGEGLLTLLYHVALDDVIDGRGGAKQKLIFFFFNKCTSAGFTAGKPTLRDAAPPAHTAELSAGLMPCLF